MLESSRLLILRWVQMNYLLKLIHVIPMDRIKFLHGGKSWFWCNLFYKLSEVVPHLYSVKSNGNQILCCTVHWIGCSRKHIVGPLFGCIWLHQKVGCSPYYWLYWDWHHFLRSYQRNNYIRLGYYRSAKRVYGARNYLIHLDIRIIKTLNKRLRFTELLDLERGPILRKSLYFYSLMRLRSTSLILKLVDLTIHHCIYIVRTNWKINTGSRTKCSWLLQLIHL